MLVCALACAQVAIVRLLKQLSEVYSTMQITELAALVPFATFSDVESIVVDAVKYDYLQVRRPAWVDASCYLLLMGVSRCHKLACFLVE